jgi:hypothetical protein
MKSLVTIDVSLDLAGPFAESGRARRAAVARCLRRLFSSPAWRAGDEAVEGVFGAAEIEHRYRDRVSGTAVRVREAPVSEAREVRALALVRPAARRNRPGAAELETMAAEALLYLEAVSLAFADRDIEVRGGRRFLSARRFRETAEWSGRPRRVRGVYCAAVWESMIGAFAADLGPSAAGSMLETVREHHAVWPLSLEFTAEFFPLALKLFRLVTAELATQEAAADADGAAPRRVIPFTPSRPAEDLAACAEQK